MSETKIANITILEVVGGVLLRFPKDEDLNHSLTRAFPKARWDVASRAWFLPGKLALKRASKWASEIEVEAKARLKAEQEAEFEGRIINPAKALQVRRSEIKSSQVMIFGDRVVYPFPFCEEALPIARQLPSAKFDRDQKAWSWRAKAIEDIQAIIDGCNQITALVLAQEARKAIEKAARQSQWDVEKQSARSERERNSLVWLASDAPPDGTTMRSRLGVVVVTGSTRAFKVDLDAFSIDSPGLPSLDEEWCVRLFVRPATGEEIARLEARELERRARAEARQLIDDWTNRVSREGDSPVLGSKPTGEVLWADLKSQMVGYTQELILAGHDLWFVIYDGTDGGMWGEYNLGYNTRGSRLTVTDQDIEELRAAVAKVGKEHVYA